MNNIHSSMASKKAPLYPRVALCVTGASGSIYAQRMLEALIEFSPRIYLIATKTGKQVVKHEVGDYKSSYNLSSILDGNIPTDLREKLRVFSEDDFFAPIASGSSAASHVVIMPCSMGTLGRVAGAMSSNLIERVADVMLKQKKPLVIIPRESPLNLIHLKNMTSLLEAGAHILPAMPGFYQKPKSIDDLADFVVGRALECMGFEHDLYPAWNRRMI